MAGSVGGVRDIKNVSLLSKAVMEHTGHVMLVGEGAQKFRVRHGLSARESADRSLAQSLVAVERNHVEPGLVGTRSRPIRNLQAPGRDHRLSPSYGRSVVSKAEGCCAAKLGIEPEFRAAAIQRVLHPPTGTIHCSALNEKGEISGATTTSGLAWKLAGTRRRFADHRSGMLLPIRIRRGGRHRQRRREHQSLRRAYLYRNMRRGMSPTGSGHGRAEAHRARAYGEVSVLSCASST